MKVSVYKIGRKRKGKTENASFIKISFISISFYETFTYLL